jgi:hypothetical protein
MSVTTPEPAPAQPYSRARGGFTHPDAPRHAAIAFAAEGATGAEIRRGAHPEDRVLAELADALDALAAEGLDRAACREIIGFGPDPADGAS